LSDVAKVLRVETATLSSLAVRLERDGLLVREPSPKDKRAMLLHLTPRARELGQQAEQITQARHNKVAKAINYMFEKHGRWQAFTAFLDDGRICLTNNAAERALRGVALGRRVAALCRLRARR